MNRSSFVACGTAATIINSENTEANDAAQDEKQHKSARVDMRLPPKGHGKKGKNPKEQQTPYSAFHESSSLCW